MLFVPTELGREEKVDHDDEDSTSLLLQVFCFYLSQSLLLVTYQIFSVSCFVSFLLVFRL
ncbi:hypothetical protein CsatB_015605 [Cannabis sativa]